MMKLVKKRSEFVLDMEKQRRKRKEVFFIIFTVFIVFISIIIDIIVIITSVRSQAVLWPSQQRFGRTHVRLMRLTSS